MKYKYAKPHSPYGCESCRSTLMRIGASNISIFPTLVFAMVAAACSIQAEINGQRAERMASQS